MPPKSKFKSMPIISQNKNALGSFSEGPTKYCTGMPLETRFKSMTNFMQNESVSIPTTISQNRSTLDPVPGMAPQTRSKRVTNDMHNDTTLIPAIVRQKGHAPSPPVGYTTLGAYIKAHQTKGGDYPNEYTRSICEKVVETCQEKDLMSSSEPTILSPILDVVYNGHHGGFERGCGLGWSRMSRWGDSGNQASNYNIKQLTIELQNAKAEIEAMHARDKEREEAMKAREKEREEAMKAREAEREEAMQSREREMQARMERMEAMLTMRFSER